MKHVYVLRSLSSPDRYYVGATIDVDRRVKEHNSGESPHTNRFRPWRVQVTISFEDEPKADAFEAYLKSGSGRAFSKKHFS
jgi:predicted GIY-YIG superfamily endonuclease